MSIRLLSRKTLAIALAALIGIYLLFGWLALPPLLQSQAQQFISEKTGHRLSMDPPDFNPFSLALRLHNVRLEEPDGKPLLAFKELLIDLSTESLVRWAYVFDAIHLDGLEATVAELPGERLNWSALIESMKSPDDKPGVPTAENADARSALPRLIVHELKLSNGRLDIADRRGEPALSTRVEPLDLELTDLSTLPDDKGPYQLSARTGFGARIRWQGEVGVNPLSIVGNFSIDDIALARLPPAIKLPAGLAQPEGMGSLSANYRLSQSRGQIDFTLDQLTAKLAGLKVRRSNQAEAFFSVDSIEARDGHFDLRQHSIVIAAIQFEGGGIHAVRDADGSLDLASLRPPAPSAGASTDAAPAAAAPWHFRIGHLGLDKFALALRDRSVAPAAEIALQDIAVGVDGVSDDFKAAWPVRASFKAGAGGSFSAEGKVVAGEPSAEFQIKLADLALKPAQPYLGALTTLKIADGRVSAEGRVRYGVKDTGYRGSFAARKLRLTEGPADQTFLAWESLASHSVDASQARLAIRELTLDGLDTRLLIAKDKSVNITRVMRKPPDAPAAIVAPAPTAAPAKAAPMFPVSIERLRIRRGGLEFADLSLALPFGTHIHDLAGSINGISSRGGVPAQVELDGQVDDYGLARAVGQVDLLAPTDFMDLKVVFRNVEMTRLTPYSATFAGRKIDSGKLSLDLEYKINHRQLSGENQVVMEQLTLGEHIDSPDAKNLPLDLAIALLQDSDGRIDLGLPVSGSLDDPQFSYGQLVWKVIVNVLTKIVTAPFRALGALFGGAEKLDAISFEAGQPQLTPPEREKLVKLAAALKKRPGLALSVAGTWAEADRAALQDLQLRRALAKKLGLAADGNADPGPMSTAQPEVRKSIEDLAADRQGGGELASLKEGFRKANPGQMEESTSGKMMSRLTGVFQKKRDLNEAELAQMKGADFHTLLYERLRAQEAVADETLRALAKTRGEAALAVLKSADAPADRASLLEPEKADADGAEVKLKMDLKPVARQAGAVTPAAVPATQ